MAISTGDLSQALRELSDLRFGDLDLDEAMRRIVHTTHRIFDVDGAGLMLADADQVLRNAAVSDDRFAALEEIQERYGEGPCITAYEDKELVCVDDLTDESAGKRWPTFSPAAVERGVSAVLASPIPFDRAAVGVVAVLSEDVHPWTPEGELALMAFTDLAALLLTSVLRGHQQTQLASQLQGALESRTVIEQAKGYLAARESISVREAYEQLRSKARRERRRLSVVAAELLESAGSRHPDG